MKKLYLLMILGLVLVASAHALIITGGNQAVRSEALKFINKNNLSGYAYRVHFASYKNAYYDAYAWYETRRIIIYEQSWNDQGVLAHEFGHLISEKRGNNRYNYEYNEAQAEKVLQELLS